MSVAAKQDFEEIRVLLDSRGVRVSLRQFTEMVQEAVARLPKVLLSGFEVGRWAYRDMTTVSVFHPAS